ncbi:hypothetical protein M430DRAFT_18117 [Amorphotheca resinae ATCC 22711]|uniref:Inosine/uridine-preferring nucleoside hydrolase domain-containing protein n=1 Tax=Amorphotheca resinae ATCC 22711 TaxID=857342 RepID=A0A2T3B715_AMORE|nr:hypothetical protein M430DRAFT_18117 [Amorphotheca resinae ATCC 22711]PSS22567.1 hypothetical protein M430DRAFT_18117 [Amorphotheca resinae ATCC 22711]
MSRQVALGPDDPPDNEDPTPSGNFIENLKNRFMEKSKSILGLWPKIPKGLNHAERDIYDRLLKTLKNRVASGQKPPRLAVITDLAKDYDDLMAMVLLGELHRLGLVELEAFVANLMPAQQRARFGRGALDLLDLQKTPIAVGSAGSERQHKVNEYEFKHCSFMAPCTTTFEKGEDLLLQILGKAAEEERKLTLVLLSSLMDISEFTNEHPELVRKAINRVSVQGGMFFDGEGVLKADNTATNNNFALDHAMAFTKYIQDENIPSMVYTKVAAFATKIYSEFFVELAATGHPLGIHLRKTQLAQDIKFYSDTIDEKTRFRPFMTPKWFLTNKSTWFTEGHSEDPDIEPYPTPEQVVPYLTVVVAYDALAALGAAGEDALADLGALKPACSSDVHRIVGVGPSANTPGKVEDPGVFGEQMATAIKALVKGSLLASMQGLN